VLTLPIENFRYYVRLYQNFHTDDNKGMLDIPPYGGGSIAWVGDDYASPSPNASPTAKAQSVGFCALNF